MLTLAVTAHARALTERLTLMAAITDIRYRISVTISVTLPVTDIAGTAARHQAGRASSRDEAASAAMGNRSHITNGNSESRLSQRAIARGSSNGQSPARGISPMAIASHAYRNGRSLAAAANHLSQRPIADCNGQALSATANRPLQRTPADCDGRSRVATVGHALRRSVTRCNGRSRVGHAQS